MIREIIKTQIKNPPAQLDLDFKEGIDVEEIRKSIEKKEKDGEDLNEIEKAQKATDALILKHGREDQKDITAQYRG